MDYIRHWRQFFLPQKTPLHLRLSDATEAPTSLIQAGSVQSVIRGRGQILREGVQIIAAGGEMELLLKGDHCRGKLQETVRNFKRDWLQSVYVGFLQKQEFLSKNN